MDLSLARVWEPGSGQLVIESIRTSGRLGMAGLFFALALVGAGLVWRQRTEGWLVALYPWAPLALVFGAIAAVLALGSQSKAFRRDTRTAELRAGLGPFRAARSLPLPAAGRVRISLRREPVSRAGGIKAPDTRWYDVAVEGQPGLGFTLASDREAARTFARNLASLLGYTLVDGVEDDGVERRPGRGGSAPS